MQDWVERAARRLGVRVWCIADDPIAGFAGVRLDVAKRRYGIDPQLRAGDLDDAPRHSLAVGQGLCSPDMPAAIYDGSVRVSLEERARSHAEGFEFYNGNLARFLGLSVERRYDERPHLTIQAGHTSHFTSLGTNHILERSPDLRQHAWAERGLEGLDGSPLANTLAIHLILHSSKAIYYVQRDRVGVASGLYNSTVCGAIEAEPGRWLSEEAIADTAVGEAERELGVAIDPGKIRWLAVATSIATCRTAVLGVCQIPDEAPIIAASAGQAIEGREVTDAARLGDLRPHKRIHELRLGWSLRHLEFKLAHLGFAVPIPRPPFRVPLVIREKGLQARECRGLGPWRRDVGAWAPLGAMTLLLAMRALVARDRFSRSYALAEEEIRAQVHPG